MNIYLSKSKYFHFSSSEKSVKIFSKSWWLDATSDNWNAVIVEDGDSIIAVWPFAIDKNNFFTKLTNPVLTQKLGPWFSDKINLNNQKKAEIISQMIKSMPNHHLIEQSLSENESFWLPYFWNGFEQTTRYSYILDFKKDEPKLTKRRRSEIRKATDSNLKVKYDTSIEDFYELNMLSFKRQKRKAPYDLFFLQKLHKACQENNSSKIISIVDDANNLQAAGYYVFDSERFFYLMGGFDPKFSLGAMTLCQLTAIEDARKKQLIFDFEGSMHKGIGEFFGSFGAQPEQYFRLKKSNSKILSFLSIFKT